jgi:N6-L-threonylcarbamoyladenine synthase
MLHSGDLDFSFSGLKTAVLTHSRKLGMNVCEQSKADLARGFVDAAVDVLTTKSIAALKQTGLNRLVVAGGVGANRQLREALSAAAKKRRFEVHYPDLSLCTDNGAMIALAGALRLARWPDQAVRDYAFTVKPRWDLTSLAAA